MVKTSPSKASRVVLIPGWGVKIPHASGAKYQNIKQKQYCNKFNKDFKNGPNKKKIFKKHFFKLGREGGGREDRDGEYM